jgi:hypothetical protein
MEKANPFQDSKQRFVGAYVPPCLADYLRLCSMMEKQSLSHLLQKIIDAERGRNDEYNVIKIIIEQAISEWERRAESGVMKKRTYLKEVEDELKRKKVSKLHISLILKELQDRI